jgi:hypothetical protein
MSALPAFREPEIIFATVEGVMDTLQSPNAWDADNHDADWWTQRLDDADFFSNLDRFDKRAILYAIARDTTHWTQDVRRNLRNAVDAEIAG